MKKILSLALAAAMALSLAACGNNGSQTSQSSNSGAALPTLETPASRKRSISPTESRSL